jgi:putative flippase GtrA
MITKDEFWRLFRFGLVGGGATIVDLGIATLCLHLWPEISEYLVTSIGFFMAFLIFLA